MNIPDCTLVTSCFDLSKYHSHARTNDKALKGIDILLKLPIYIIIFGNSELLNNIKERRNSYGYENMTHYVFIEYEEIWSSQFTDIVKSNREKYWPTRDLRTCPESHLLCCNKFDFVLKGIELNPFNTSTFGWIDSNLYVDENTNKICENYTMNKLPFVLQHIKKDKFHIQIINVVDKKYKEINLKKEYYQQYRWLVSGCLFTCGIEVGIKILNKLKQNVKNTTLNGYGHGEEMLYLEILDDFYDDIERSYGDYRQTLNNFIYTTKNVGYIYYNIISNYYNHNYYKECYDCCKHIIYSIENNLIEDDIDYGIYVNIYRYYLLSSINCNVDSYKIVDKVNQICNINKSFKGAMGDIFV